MMLIDDICTNCTVTNGEEGDIPKMVIRKMLNVLELKTEKKHVHWRLTHEWVNQNWQK